MDKKLGLLPILAGMILLVGGTALAAAPKAKLPLVVYAEGSGAMPFVPSGYMGNTGAIKMNAGWTADPHSGKTCLKAEYTAGSNWGGVVWQNPANNWGSKVGGWNLSGAKTLSFWARGDKGTEIVSFLYGLVGKDKANGDTSSGKLNNVHLTKAWRKYTIALSGKNMSHIITGFAWTLAPAGAPETFYLDDIRYQ